MWQRKFVLTPELALLILYECPFAPGHNLYSRCFLDQWIFHLGGVNPQWSHPVDTIKINAHSNQRNKVSTQYKEKFTRLTSSSLKLVLNGSDNDPSLLAQMLLKTHCQENSEIQESFRLLIEHTLTTKE